MLKEFSLFMFKFYQDKKFNDLNSTMHCNVLINKEKEVQGALLHLVLQPSPIGAFASIDTSYF